MQTIDQLPEGARPVKGNKNYAALLHAVKDAGGKWVMTDAADVRGRTPGEKATALQMAATGRQMRVETALEGEKVYVRLVEQEVANG